MYFIYIAVYLDQTGYLKAWFTKSFCLEVPLNSDCFMIFKIQNKGNKIMYNFLETLSVFQSSISV